MHSRNYGGSTTAASFLTTLTTQPALRRVISQTPALAQLVRALMGQALKAGSLSAGVLAQLIGQSGLFHEAKLTCRTRRLTAKQVLRRSYSSFSEA